MVGGLGAADLDLRWPWSRSCLATLISGLRGPIRTSRHCWPRTLPPGSGTRYSGKLLRRLLRETMILDLESSVPAGQTGAAYRNRTDDLFITRALRYFDDMPACTAHLAVCVHGRPLACRTGHSRCHSDSHSLRGHCPRVFVCHANPKLLGTDRPAVCEIHEGDHVLLPDAVFGADSGYCWRGHVPVPVCSRL